MWLWLLSALLMPARPAPTRPGPCFAVAVTPWRPALALGADTAFVLPPRAVRVTTESAGGFGRSGRLVRATARRPGSVHDRGIWRPVARDSAELIFTTGFSGLVLHLRAVPGVGWAGTAETFWDFDRPAQHAEATLTPTACARPVSGRSAA